MLSPRTRELEFGRKIYDQLKFGIKFRNRALRNFAGGYKISQALGKFRRLCEIFFACVAKFRNPYENVHRFVKISCILCFRFLFLFFMFNPLENSYQTLKLVRLRFKTKTHEHISSQHFSFDKSNTKLN